MPQQHNEEEAEAGRGGSRQDEKDDASDNDSSSREVLLLGMDQYLKGAEWVDMIRAFMDSRCESFMATPPYELEHHQAFKAFQHMAEQALQKVLVVLGCSDEEVFVGLLEQYTAQPLKGPMDAAVKDVIKTLMDLQDFHTFAEAMRQRAEENGGGGGNGQPQAAQPSTTATTTGSSGTPSSPSCGGESKQPEGEEQQQQPQGGGAYDLSDENWVAQLSTAKEIMAGYEARTLTQEDEVFVGWAESVLAFTEEVNRISSSSSNSSDGSGADNHRLTTITARLLRERFRVDVVVAQRMARQPYAIALWQLTEGGQQKGGGGEEEERAGAMKLLLELQEEARGQAKEAKAQAVTQWREATSTNREGGGGGEEELERLYLMFKESGGRDISPAVDFIYDHLLNSGLVPMELHGSVCLPITTWVELEAVAIDVQRAVQKRLQAEEEEEEEKARKATRRRSSGGAGGDAASSSAPTKLHWVERRDEASEGRYYYIDTRTGHSQWDKPDEPYVRWVGATPKLSMASSKGLSYKITLDDNHAHELLATTSTKQQQDQQQPPVELDMVPPPSVPPPPLEQAPQQQPQEEAKRRPSGGGGRPPPLVIPPTAGAGSGLQSYHLAPLSTTAASAASKLVGHMLTSGRHAGRGGVDPRLMMALSPSAMGYLAQAMTPMAGGGSSVMKTPLAGRALPASTPAAAAGGRK